MQIDEQMFERVKLLERQAGRNGGSLAQSGRQTCRYATPPYDYRCTGIPVGSKVAEVQLCLRHLRLALELIEAEGISLAT